MSKYSDWTNEQINREIATRLGWTVAPFPESEQAEFSNLNYNFAIFNPDGVWIAGFENEPELDDWLYVVPFWSSDLNEAWELVASLPDHYFIYLARVFDDIVARIVNVETGEAYVKVECKKPARALDEAWLSWDDLS